MFKNKLLPIDPLAAARFSITTVNRVTISQIKNRILGDSYAQLAGDYLRIESCDLPCAISFTNDPRNVIACTPGMIIRGAFSGVTIFHPDYSVVDTGTSPQVIFVVGRGNQIEVDNANITTGVGVPYNVNGSGLNFLNLDVDVVRPYTELICKGYLHCSALNPLTIRTEALFYTESSAATFVRALQITSENGKLYNGLYSRPGCTGIASLTDGATVQVVPIDLRLTIPSNADFARISFQTNLAAGVAAWNPYLNFSLR